MRYDNGIRATGILLMTLICWATPPAYAEDSVRDMVRKLNSRSIIVEPVNEKLDEIQKKQETGKPLSDDDREKIAKAAEQTEGKLDVAVLFAYNSDQLRLESIPTLTKLGQALSSDELKMGKFLIN